MLARGFLLGPLEGVLLLDGVPSLLHLLLLLLPLVLLLPSLRVVLRSLLAIRGLLGQALVRGLHVPEPLQLAAQRRLQPLALVLLHARELVLLERDRVALLGGGRRDDEVSIGCLAP